LESTLEVQSDLDGLAYDVTTHPVSGAVTLNGAVPGQPASASCRGERGHVSLESAADGTMAFRIPCAAPGTAFTFGGEAYAGSYVVSVTGHPGSSDLPTETFRPGITVDASAPVTDLAVDVTAHAVSGAVTVNGAAPPACTGAPGALWGEINAYEP